MRELDMFGKIESGGFVTSKDNELLERDWLRDNVGELVHKIYKKGKASKRLKQIRFLYLCIRELGKFLGYADLTDLKLSVKEAMGYFEIREVKNITTGKVEIHKRYLSFADLKVDTAIERTEDMLRICDEQSFPMRQKYIDHMIGDKNE